MFRLLRNRRRFAGTPGILPVSVVFFCSALLISIPSFAARDSDSIVRRVDGFEANRVLVYGAAEVQISQGDTVELLLQGRETELEAEPFVIEDGTVMLGRTADGSDSRQISSVRYRLTLPDLAYLHLQGSGDVYVRPFKVDDIDVVIDGSGDVRLFDVEAGQVLFKVRGSGDIRAAKVRAESLELRLAGSGDIQLGTVNANSLVAAISGSGDIGSGESGFGKSLAINIVGSADVNLTSVDSSAASINIVGSGTARIGVSESLSVNIIGAGNIHYRGEPERNSLILGAGKAYQQK